MSENYENSYAQVKINNVNFRKSIELCANSGVQEKQTTTDKYQLLDLTRRNNSVIVSYEIKSLNAIVTWEKRKQ